MADTFHSEVDCAAEDSEAISALIHKETSCFRDLDIEGWSACYLHSPRTCSVCASSGLGISVLRGWDEIYADMVSLLSLGRTPCAMEEFRKDNMQITVDGDTAWVVYDGWMRAKDGSEADNVETAILERTEDGWRIVYNAFANLRMTKTTPGPVALDSGGHLVWATPAATEALRDHPAFIVSHGRLRARRSNWDKVLQAAIGRAGELHGYFHHQDYLSTAGAPFRTPVVLGEDETGAAIVCVLHVKDGFTYLDVDPAADLDRRLAVAKMIFGLSPGQMEMAARIASGRSLTDAAEDLGISINTARTHLKRIYDKTGVNAQTALVRLLLSVG